MILSNFSVEFCTSHPYCKLENNLSIFSQSDKKKKNLLKGISIEVPDFSSKLQKQSFNSCPSICSPYCRSLPCPFHLSCWWLLPVSGLHVSHLGRRKDYLPGQWWTSGSHRRLFCDGWYHPLHWRCRSA